MRLSRFGVAAALAFGACSHGGEEKAPVKPEASPVAQAKPEAKPAPPAPAVAAPEGKGAAAPVPEALAGVWEKAEQPMRGMRIEFAAGKGMAEIAVVKPPGDDAEAVAFYTEKNGGKADVGARMSSCMTKVWSVGTIKFSDLAPAAGKEEWVGKSNRLLFRPTTCDGATPRPEDAVLRLKSKDELVATVTNASLKKSETKTETWKRVTP